MTDQQKQSLIAVLSAAHHNAKMVYDQLDSLANPDDDSFPDFRIDNARDEVEQAVKSIKEALDGLNG